MVTPRLLVLTSTLPARPDDGTPAFVLDLSQQLAQEFEIRILAPAVPGAALREQLTNGVEVIRYRFFPRRWEDLADGAILENVRARRSRLLQVPFLLGGLAMALAREVRRFKPHALHAHWIIPQAIVARRVAGRVPTVVTTLGGDLYALNGGVARALKSEALKRAAAVTVMNEDMRRRAIDLGSDPGVTMVLPMGARLSTLETARDRTRIGSAVRLLAVGRLVQKKGFDVLLDALRQVDFPYHLEIVGDGPEREHLEHRACHLPVTFAGQLGRGELARRYLDADIAVFPSRRAMSGDQDGLPVAMLEAMGAGCAIVASDLPGLNEAIRPQESGVLVPPDDTSFLANSLSALAADPGRRAELGEAARHRAQSYSVETVGERYRALFRSLIDS